MEELAARAALLVPPGNPEALAGALDMVVRGDANLAERRRRGLAIAASHTWSAAAEGHVAAYRAALRRGASAAAALARTGTHPT